MFKYDSIAVSSAWESISVSMCYSQGGGVNTPLSRLMYCTHHLYSFVFVNRSVPFLCVVWLSSVARSCATRDESNKDNVCKPTITAGINRPPPSETISHVTRVPNYKTCLTGLKDSCLSRTRDPVRRCLFIYDGEVGRRMKSTAEGEESPLGGQLERRDRAKERSDERDIRADAEDAEYRSGSDAKKGQRLLLGT